LYHAYPYGIILIGALRDIMQSSFGNSLANENKSFSSLPYPCNNINKGDSFDNEDLFITE
jgi:hypothetical protein